MRWRSTAPAAAPLPPQPGGELAANPRRRSLGGGEDVERDHFAEVLFEADRARHEISLRQGRPALAVFWCAWGAQQLPSLGRDLLVLGGALAPEALLDSPRPSAGPMNSAGAEECLAASCPRSSAMFLELRTLLSLSGRM